MQYYHFTSWEPAPLDKVLTARLPAALLEYDNGNKEPLKALQIATTQPWFDLGGWRFNLLPYLKKYWVKTRYYGILEYYAMNKTAIRNELKSQCIKITEV